MSRDQAEQRAELERTIQNTSALATQKPLRRTPHDPLNRHPSHKNITKHPEKYKTTNGQNNITNRIINMEDDWRRNNSEKAGKEKVKKRGSARITESCDSFNNGIMRRREVLNNFQKFVKGEISDTVGMVKHINDRLGFQIVTTMGSRRTDKLENKRRTLKRLKTKNKMKRRCDENEKSENFENYGERVIKRLMKEVDSQADLNLSKAGKKYQNVEEIRKAGERSELEIKFQRLMIDKQERVLSSPISPRTAAALEGMTTLMGNWSTLSESAFRSHLEKGEEDEEGLSSTLKRTMLLELADRKEQEEKEETNVKEEEGTAEEILDDGEEEEEREQSDAGTLPTIEISSSATSADEDDIEVLRITGLTDTEAGTEDGNEVKDIERLEFAADPLGDQLSAGG